MIEMISNVAMATAPVLEVDDGISHHVLNMASAGSEALVAILAIILIFGTPIMLVVSILLYKMRKQRLLHQTILSLVEKGAAIPPQLFEAQNKKSDLRRGIILSCVGVGTIVLFALNADPGTWGIGLIPLLIGMGYLLLWKLDKQNNSVVD